jgi:deoxyribose-phosphate aldolase
LYGTSERLVESDNQPLPAEIAQMIDISAVRADSTDRAIDEAIACAERYGCYLVTTLPSQTAYAKRLLAGVPAIRLGGNVGFPSGGQTTRVKAVEAAELVEMGVDEVDMVLDVAALLSGRTRHVLDDIVAVVQASEGRPVKAILECHYLEDDHIRTACDLAIEAGADYVKTGTGWAPTGATLHNITVIHDHVRDAIAIKASGGIRDLTTLLEMRQLGASRFGISARHVGTLLDHVAS